MSRESIHCLGKAYLPHVEESVAVALAWGQGRVTTLVPGGAPGAERRDPLPPAVQCKRNSGADGEHEIEEEIERDASPSE